MTSSSLLSYLREIKLLLSENFIHLNDEKNECILFSTPSLTSVALSNLGSLASSFKQKVKNLGVTFDSCMKFEKTLILLSVRASKSFMLLSVEDLIIAMHFISVCARLPLLTLS